MSLPPLNKYFQAFFETLLMVSASALIAIGLGLLLSAKASLLAKKLHASSAVNDSVGAIRRSSVRAQGLLQVGQYVFFQTEIAAVISHFQQGRSRKSGGNSATWCWCTAYATKKS